MPGPAVRYARSHEQYQKHEGGIAMCGRTEIVALLVGSLLVGTIRGGMVVLQMPTTQAAGETVSW